MSLFRKQAMPVLAALLAFGSTAPAQQPQQNAPHIGYVFPAGGQQGTTFEVTVGGQFLDANTTVHISGTGVSATLAEYIKPLTMKQANDLREKLKELQDKKAAAFVRPGKAASQPTTRPVWTPDDEKMLEDLRKKLSTFVRRPPNPAIAETMTLHVTVAPDAEPGEREIRLALPAGLTNPLNFYIGQLPEFSKPPAKVTSDLPNLPKFRNRNEAKGPPPDPEPKITLPTVVNGQITPGEVDRYRFAAKKGQRLVLSACARELIPYLPDAVPGWFQATLALYDAKGNEVAYADHFRFHPDPVIYYEVPADGEYVAEIRDSIYRGREDFVYRLTLGELPFITAIFPLGGPVGVTTTVELQGWNLPATRLTVKGKDKQPGVFPVSVRQGAWLSNQVPFVLDNLPEIQDKEPNNDPGSAQLVTLPVVINGKIDQPGDWDVYRFEGRTGQEVVAEVYARRLDSPLDSVLKLTDADGKQIAYNDDHEDRGAGLDTHYADSWLKTILPVGGTYYLHVGDVQHKGGPEYTYRLRISSPRPDYELRATPSSLTARGGASVPITVYALRKDGFAGEITVTIKDAPAGFTLGGARIPANQDQVKLTLTVPPASPKEPINLHLEGRAMIQGREVLHGVVPAEDMMQAFAYRHLVPSDELLVDVLNPIRRMAQAPLKILEAMPVKIPSGGTARIHVEMPTNTPQGKVEMELSDPPDGIVIKSITPSREGTEIVLACDGAKIKPGLKGNLIINALMERNPPSGTQPAQGNRRRVPLGTLPAISFQIVSQ